MVSSSIHINSNLDYHSVQYESHAVHITVVSPTYVQGQVKCDKRRDSTADCCCRITHLVLTLIKTRTPHGS